MKLRTFLGLVAVICFGIPGAVAAAETTSPVRIIFDTDMGSDCDDAGAMSVLHKLADAGEVEILATVFSSGKNPYGVGVVDAINTWYGRGDLPVGQYKKDDVGDPVDRYCRRIATNTKTFPHDLVETAPEIISVYKDALRQQPDVSVTIVTVGHPHALSYLMKDAEGLDLVRRKVKQCVSMAGAPDKPEEEWNVSRNGVEKYMGAVLKGWPTPYYFSPVGANVITGNKKLPAAPERNPVREAYLHYDGSLQKGRSSWDQLAVLFAVRPQLFKIERGTLSQVEGNRVHWTSAPAEPPRYRVTPLQSPAELERLLEDLMSAPPKEQNKRID